jgi:hypothetical protein
MTEVIMFKNFLWVYYVTYDRPIISNINILIVFTERNSFFFRFLIYENLEPW